MADDLIHDGWVSVENGRIAAVGSGPRSDAVDLGRVAVLPALVNAHTHLELSYLRGKVPPKGSFLDWIRPLMAARREYPDAADPVILQAARRAIDDARASGTGLVGDISNTLVTIPLLREAGMPGRVFVELLGFNAADPTGRVAEARARIAAVLDEPARAEAGLLGPPSHERIRVSLAPHAPYSVSPALFGAIRADLDADAHGVSSVHLGESPDEVEFLARGSGSWPVLLRELGAWNETWKPPAQSPVEYLSDIGFLDSRVLAIHAVQCTGDDLARLRAVGATVVSCPRSNRHVGVGDPPIEAFYAMGVSVAFGTDSLASVEDLNMFGELAAARRLAPRVPARDLLRSATICGARALGFGDTLGSIETGKEASLIAVRLPEGVSDVEEYLLSGIEPDAIVWLDSSNPKAQ
jgi:cytosine/adenosine deaminase-related metal-dependent hydrolase